jgi:hypothetical protein
VTVVLVVSRRRRVEISWKARPPEDVVGYDLYRRRRGPDRDTRQARGVVGQ